MNARTALSLTAEDEPQNSTELDIVDRLFVLTTRLSYTYEEADAFISMIHNEMGEPDPNTRLAWRFYLGQDPPEFRISIVLFRQFLMGEFTVEDLTNQRVLNDETAKNPSMKMLLKSFVCPLEDVPLYMSSFPQVCMWRFSLGK